MAKDIYQKISIACSNDIMEAFANFLLERNTGGLVVDDGRQNGRIMLTAYLKPDQDKPFTNDEIDSFFEQNKTYFPNADYQILTLDYIKAEDWLAGWKKTFVPIHVTDRIVVRPTWQDYDIKPGEIEIIIDPKMAFGTGHHETTSQCLQIMENMEIAGRRFLDYGCGTGILAIAAAGIGAAEVLACDIDPEAVICAEENFNLNKVRVELHESGKYVADPPCDIIAANLSIDQIIEVFDELANSLTSNGQVILSGIPIDDKDRFLDFLKNKPYKIIDELAGSEWISYVCERSG